MKHNPKLTLLAAALALLSSTASLAVDEKIFSGAECQPTNGDEAAGLNSAYNGLWNDSGARRFVTCPIVRDNHANVNGTFLVRVRVTNGTECTLFSLDSLGGTVASTFDDTVDGFSSLDVDVNASANLGYYTLVCDIPNGGRVWSYRISEF